MWLIPKSSSEAWNENDWEKGERKKETLNQEYAGEKEKQRKEGKSYTTNDMYPLSRENNKKEDEENFLWQERQESFGRERKYKKIKGKWKWFTKEGRKCRSCTLENCLKAYERRLTCSPPKASDTVMMKLNERLHGWRKITKNRPATNNEIKSKDIYFFM